MAMSSNKTVKGEIILTGNDPFRYFVIICDNGKKFRLDGDIDIEAMLPFKERKVVLTYEKTDRELLMPIVKVIKIKLAE